MFLPPLRPLCFRDTSLPRPLRCWLTARYYSVHNAHLTLAAFRLHGRRKEYDALRGLISAADAHIPTFDELRPGVPICDADLCWRCADAIVRLDAPQESGDSDAAPSFSTRPQPPPQPQPPPPTRVGAASHPEDGRRRAQHLHLLPRNAYGGALSDDLNPAAGHDESRVGLAQRVSPEWEANPTRPPQCGAFGDDLSLAPAAAGEERQGMTAAVALPDSWQTPAGNGRSRGARRSSGGDSGAFVPPAGSIGASHAFYVASAAEGAGAEWQVQSDRGNRRLVVVEEESCRHAARGSHSDVFLTPSPPPPLMDVKPLWGGASLAPSVGAAVGAGSMYSAAAPEFDSRVQRSGGGWIGPKHHQPISGETGPREPWAHASAVIGDQRGGGSGALPPHVLQLHHGQSHQQPPLGVLGDELIAGDRDGGAGGVRRRDWREGGRVAQPEVAPTPIGGVLPPSFRSTGRVGGRYQPGGCSWSEMAPVSTVDRGLLRALPAATANENPLGHHAKLAAGAPRGAEMRGCRIGAGSGDSCSGSSEGGGCGVAGTIHGVGELERQVELAETVSVSVDEGSWAQVSPKGRHGSDGELDVCSDLVGMLLEEEEPSPEHCGRGRPRRAVAL